LRAREGTLHREAPSRTQPCSENHSSSFAITLRGGARRPAPAGVVLRA
jgi:hypothetical protein